MKIKKFFEKIIELGKFFIFLVKLFFIFLISSDDNIVLIYNILCSVRGNDFNFKPSYNTLIKGRISFDLFLEMFFDISL